MAVQFFYQDFKKTESADAYLRSQIQGVVDKFFRDGRYSLYIRTRTVRERNEPKHNVFACELRLDLPNNAPVFIKKEGHDFFQTVKGLGEALKKAVEKIADLRVAGPQLAPVKVYN